MIEKKPIRIIVSFTNISDVTEIPIEIWEGKELVEEYFLHADPNATNKEAVFYTPKSSGEIEIQYTSPEYVSAYDGGSYITPRCIYYADKLTIASSKPAYYKSFDGYISESSISKSTDGNSYEITPIIKNIKKVYLDLTESTTDGWYCFLSILNEAENKVLDISSRGLSTTYSHNITVNGSNTNIANLANDKTYDWLYYNPQNNDEVIIDVERFFGELGVISSWQENFGTACLVNIETVDSSSSSINTVLANEDKEVIYNLQGQRLQKPQRGINIINGKKVIIK